MPLGLHDRPPAGLLDCSATDLHARLGGPALILVEGERQPALFISVLLHGNETSGWDGLRRFLATYSRPKRSLAIFVGNTEAAARGLRVLPGQADFNRIWRDATGEGAALAAALQAALADLELFAAVDLHNNTGHNPYYSVVTDLDGRNLGLAELFSDKAVFVEEPDTVLTRTFAGRCPAVALEIGPVGDPRGLTRVLDYLERLLELEAVPRSSVAELALFRSLARVHVRGGVSFRFEGDADGGDAELALTGGVEAVNFHELASGTPFGTTRREVADVLEVLDVRHRDVTREFLARRGTEVVLNRPVVPAMYTTDPYVVRQDCLCYFMERLTSG